MQPMDSGHINPWSVLQGLVDLEKFEHCSTETPISSPAGNDTDQHNQKDGAPK